MKFAKLAEYFEKLESETKRNELVQILADVFKQAEASEVDKICYLIQGRVAPFFEPTEIGMSTKLVEQAISSAYGVERSKVANLTSKEGDTGLAAEKLN